MAARCGARLRRRLTSGKPFAAAANDASIEYVALMPSIDRLLQYGVSSDLAGKAVAAGLTTTKARTLPRADLTTKYGLEEQEAAELKRCIVRAPIDREIADSLLDRSNHVCCICKGAKGSGVILHHIEEYEVSQDNSYANLAVLCPNDHDRAHRPGALTLGLSARQVQQAKAAWEKQVEAGNERKAARAIEVSDAAVDYVNVMRIEEMCLQHLGAVPPTTISPSLVRKSILDADLRFDEAYVRKHLSGGRYLFDYINSSETEHYRQLLAKLSAVVDFEDLSGAARSGIRALQPLEGRYAYFVGAVTSCGPGWPITRATPPLMLRNKTRKVEINWNGDANYLMSVSAISRQGRTNRYIIYGLVRTVLRSENKGPVQVTCSPLLIAQPSVYVDRTPAIAWRRYWREEQNGGDEAEDVIPEDA